MRFFAEKYLLTYKERQKEVYLVHKDGQFLWVSDRGREYPQDVQFILSNLQSYAIDFKELHVNRHSY